MDFVNNKLGTFFRMGVWCNQNYCFFRMDYHTIELRKACRVCGKRVIRQRKERGATWFVSTGVSWLKRSALTPLVTARIPTPSHSVTHAGSSCAPGKKEEQMHQLWVWYFHGVSTLSSTAR